MTKQVERIIEFANAPLHERNWRERVGAVSVERVIGRATPTTGDVVGVTSLDEALAIQRELHDLLNRIVEAAEDGSFAKRAELSERIKARVRIRVVYQPHATEGRLDAVWVTDEPSLVEYLYVHLAQSLTTDEFVAFAHCPTCGKFIYRRTRHGQRYCSDGCRALASFRRQRDGNVAEPDSILPSKPAKRPRRPS